MHVVELFETEPKTRKKETQGYLWINGSDFNAWNSVFHGNHRAVMVRVRGHRDSPADSLSSFTVLYSVSSIQHTLGMPAYFSRLFVCLIASG